MNLTEEQRKEKQRQYLARFQDNLEDHDGVGSDTAEKKDEPIRADEVSTAPGSGGNKVTGAGEEAKVPAPTVTTVIAEEIPRAKWPGVVYHDQERIEYDIPSNHEESRKGDVKVIVVAKMSTQPGAESGRKIAINNDLITYCVQEHIRVIMMTMTKRALLRGHRAGVVDLEFAPHSWPSTGVGHILGSCAKDGSVFLWWLQLVDSGDEDDNVPAVQCFQTSELKHPSASSGLFYKRIRFAPPGEGGGLLFALVDGKTVAIRVFTRANASPPSPDSSEDVFEEHMLVNDKSRGGILDICWFSPTGLASACEDGSIVLWDMTTCNVTAVVNGQDIGGTLLSLSAPTGVDNPPGGETEDSSQSAVGKSQAVVVATDEKGEMLKLLSADNQKVCGLQEVLFGSNGSHVPTSTVTSDPTGEFLVMASAKISAIFVLHYNARHRRIDAITEVPTSRPVLYISVTRSSERTVSAGKEELRDDLLICCILEEKIQLCYVSAAGCTPAYTDEELAQGVATDGHRILSTEVDREQNQVGPGSGSDPTTAAVPEVAAEGFAEATVAAKEAAPAEGVATATATATATASASVSDVQEPPHERAGEEHQVPSEAPEETKKLKAASEKTADGTEGTTVAEGIVASREGEGTQEDVKHAPSPAEESEEATSAPAVQVGEGTKPVGPNVEPALAVEKEELSAPSDGAEASASAAPATPAVPAGSPAEEKTPVLEVSDKLESAIRRRVSVETADSVRRLEAKFAEETRSRESKEKERLERLVSSVSKSLKNKIEESVEDAVAQQLAAAVLPDLKAAAETGFQRAITDEVVAQSVTEAYRQGMNSVGNGELVQHFKSSLCKGDAMQRSFAHQLRESGLATSFHDASSVMSSQVSEAISRGLSTGISAQIVETLTAMRSSTEEALNAMKELQSQMMSSAESMSRIGRDAPLIAARDFSLELDVALTAGDVSGAFDSALSSQDPALLMRVVEAFNSDRSGALSLLSQEALFSLAEALGSTLDEQSELKLDWLSDALLMVEPEDEKVRTRAEDVLQKTTGSLEAAYQALNADGDKRIARKARLLMHFVKSLIPQ